MIRKYCESVQPVHHAALRSEIQFKYIKSMSYACWVLKSMDAAIEFKPPLYPYFGILGEGSFFLIPRDHSKIRKRSEYSGSMICRMLSSLRLW